MNFFSEIKVGKKSIFEFFKYDLLKFCVYGTINMFKINCTTTKKNENLKRKFMKLILFIPFVQKTNISLLTSYLLII